MPVNNFLGEDFDYIGAFNNPRDCSPGPCMGESGDKIMDNLKGTVKYGNALLFHSDSNDNRRVQKNPGVLGNKYFIDSGVDCKTPEGDTVSRHIYVDNRPTGNVPFINQLVGNGGLPKGLIPGLLSNVERLNPVKLLNALVPEVGEAAKCKERTVTEIRQRDDGSTYSEEVKVYMTDKDYEEVEPFSSIHGDIVDDKDVYNYSKMPDDKLVQLYLSTLTIAGMYIVLKLINKK